MPASTSTVAVNLCAPFCPPSLSKVKGHVPLLSIWLRRLWGVAIKGLSTSTAWKCLATLSLAPNEHNDIRHLCHFRLALSPPTTSTLFWHVHLNMSWANVPDHVDPWMKTCDFLANSLRYVSTGHELMFHGQISWKSEVGKLTKKCHLRNVLSYFWQKKKTRPCENRPSPLFCPMGPVAPNISWTLLPLHHSMHVCCIWSGLVGVCRWIIPPRYIFGSQSHSLKPEWPPSSILGCWENL